MKIDPSIFQIDDLRLDWECLRHADLYFQFGEKLTDARMDMDKKKIASDLTASEVEQDIRNNPEAYGLDKTTDKVVEAAVKREDRYTEAMQEYLDAKHTVDVISNAMSALEAKRRTLELRIRLLEMNYRAKPYLPENTRQHVEEAEKKSDYAGIGARPRRRERDEDDD